MPAEGPWAKYSFADDSAQRRLTEEIAATDERISRLIDALENGLDASQVRARLAKLQTAKERAEIELRALAPVAPDQNAGDPADLLARIPDLTQAMRDATPLLKRQLFEAFGLQVTYDKHARIEITATITEQLADALHQGQPQPPTVPKPRSTTLTNDAPGRITALNGVAASHRAGTSNQLASARTPL